MSEQTTSARRGQTLPPWRPKVGDRVLTGSDLTSERWNLAAERARQPNVAGKVKRAFASSDKTWVVRHDDGTDAPYDEDELRPA